jgi:hypothetical protein
MSIWFLYLKAAIPDSIRRPKPRMPNNPLEIRVATAKPSITPPTTFVFLSMKGIMIAAV